MEPAARTSIEELLACICGNKPDPKCWQYEHHLSHAGEPGAFPVEAFD